MSRNGCLIEFCPQRSKCKRCDNRERCRKQKEFWDNISKEGKK